MVLCEFFEEEVQSGVQEVVIWGIDVEEDAQGLQNSNGGELSISVTLFDELKQNLVLQFGGSVLTKNNHILNELENIV